jgi:hypothetical protein
MFRDGHKRQGEDYLAGGAGVEIFLVSERAALAMATAAAAFTVNRRNVPPGNQLLKHGFHGRGFYVKVQRTIPQTDDITLIKEGNNFAEHYFMRMREASVRGII